MPRARHVAPPPHRKRRRRREDHGRPRQGRNFHERSDQQTDARRRQAVCRRLQDPPRCRRQERRGACVSLNRLAYKLPGPLAGAVASSLDDWKQNHKNSRLWQEDASLWSVTDESNWLGWLTIADEQLAHI